MCRSVRQTPQAATSSSTSPGPGCGQGRSAGRRAERAASRTIARMERRLRSLLRVTAPFGPLVETAWLREHLGEPGLVVVDARFVLGRPGAAEVAWHEGHIPGAPFLDVD